MNIDHRPSLLLQFENAKLLRNAIGHSRYTSIVAALVSTVNVLELDDDAELNALRDALDWQQLDADTRLAIDAQRRAGNTRLKAVDSSLEHMRTSLRYARYYAQQEQASHARMKLYDTADGGCYVVVGDKRHDFRELRCGVCEQSLSAVPDERIPAPLLQACYNISVPICAQCCGVQEDAPLPPLGTAGVCLLCYTFDDAIVPPRFLCSRCESLPIVRIQQQQPQQPRQEESPPVAAVAATAVGADNRPSEQEYADASTWLHSLLSGLAKESRQAALVLELVERMRKELPGIKHANAQNGHCPGFF